MVWTLKKCYYHEHFTVMNIFVVGVDCSRLKGTKETYQPPVVGPTQKNSAVKNTLGMW